jgi:hypothetical protein
VIYQIVVSHTHDVTHDGKMTCGGIAMASDTLILDIRRAQAEAASRVVRDWQPSEDLGARARVLEAVAQEWLDSPKRLRNLANDVFDRRPNDGTLLDYLNRQREALSACFTSTLDFLRATRDQAQDCVRAGQLVPSLADLEQTIRKAEQVETETFEHWEVFDHHPDLGSPDEWMTTEEVFKERVAQLSEEARRELQTRLDQASKQNGSYMGSS